MSLALRISQERERLALAKERLRGRRSLNTSLDSSSSGKGKPGNNSNRPRIDLSEASSSKISSNRRFDYRSPKRKTTGVSVRVLSTTPRSAASGSSSKKQLAVKRTSSTSEFEERLRRVAAREAALSAKSTVAQKKLEYAESELTNRNNMCDELQLQVHELQQTIIEMEEKLRTLNKDKLDGLAQRDVARKRVHGLSERVSSLERALETAHSKISDLQEELSVTKQGSGERLGTLERELLDCRATLGGTKDALDHSEKQLSVIMEKYEGQTAKLDTASLKASSLESELRTERMRHDQAAHALTLMKRQCDKLGVENKNLTKENQEEQGIIQDLTDQLTLEKERFKNVEDQLMKELESARSKLDETRAELSEAHDRTKDLNNRVMVVESDTDEEVKALRERNRMLEEQIARLTLSNNARDDMHAQTVASLSKQIEQLEQRNTTTNQTPPPPPPPPLPSVEELVVDVDLPSGECVELVIRESDDPISVIANFTKKHSLTPHISNHLEKYVCSQLYNAQASIPFSPEESDSPPPPPPSTTIYENKEEPPKRESKLRRLSRLKQNSS